MQFSLSICVYAKDNPEHFHMAMQSIIKQTVPPDEIVLVVDGPVPTAIQNVINVIQSQCWYLKIKYLNENLGHGEARRIGLEQCSNNLVAIMDADDICVIDRFERQLQCFEDDHTLSIVGGNIKEFIYNINNVVGIRKVPEYDSDIRQYLKKRCPFNQMTVMFKKDDVMNAGGYVDWYCEEDYYLWIRMMKKGYKFRNIDEVLCYVRVGSDMYQRRGGWKYFKSEAKLQKYMLENKIIGMGLYVFNITVRFVVQMAMPNSMRSFVFRKMMRNRADLGSKPYK